MAVLNLRLTRQLQQDLAEKDKKIAQLQQEMAEQRQLQTQMEKNMTEQQQLQSDMRNDTEKELTELREQVQQVHDTTQHIGLYTAGLCLPCKVFTFDQYSQRKGTGSSKEVFSDPFYSHQHGYKFKLRIRHYSSDIGAYFHLLTGEYDDQLPWPVHVKVRLELLNQAGDHHHVEKTRSLKWGKDKRNSCEAIASYLIKYSDLEKRGGGVQYMMNDCLKFRLHLTVQAA